METGKEARVLAAGVAELGLRLPPSSEDRLLAFLAELHRWNRAFNLVADAPLAEWVRIHLLDSLSIADPLRAAAAEGGRSASPAPGGPSRAGSSRSLEDGSRGSTGLLRERLPGSAGIPARSRSASPRDARRAVAFRVLDLGSGAGLPGLPLAIAFPEIRFVLLDGNGKKARFCRNAVNSLDLANVEVVEERAERYAPPAPFDAAVVRAVGSLARVRELVRPCCRGPLLAMKGRYPAREIAALGESHVETVRLRVPGLDAERHLVILR